MTNAVDSPLPSTWVELRSNSILDFDVVFSGKLSSYLVTAAVASALVLFLWWEISMHSISPHNSTTAKATISMSLRKVKPDETAITVSLAFKRLMTGQRLTTAFVDPVRRPRRNGTAKRFETL